MRRIANKTKAAITGITESILDHTVSDLEHIRFQDMW